MHILKKPDLTDPNLRAKLAKRNVDLRFLDRGEPQKIGGDKLKQIVELEGLSFSVAKTAIIAYANKLAPPVAIEIARRMAPGVYAPSFTELDAELETVRSEMNAK